MARAKSGHLCLLPTHPIKNLRGIRREGFKSEEQRKVACALSPAHSFKITHSKGKRRTHHRGTHRHIRQQAHTPPAEGQKSNPGSVRLYGGKMHYLQLPAPPTTKGVWEILLVGHNHSADASLLWDHCEAVWKPVRVNQLI
jgi:hypothetical protein